jgi:hypothetical protein
MKITGSDITMTSTHAAFEKYVKKESFSMQVGTERPRGHGHHDRVELSHEARKAEKGKEKGECCCGNGDGAQLEPRLQLLKAIIERITGSKIRVMDSGSTAPTEECATAEQAPSGKEPGAEKSAGFALSYSYYESYRESERMTFSAEGVINTSDDRQISFSLDLAMQRSFSSEISIDIQAGDAVKKDPLVINFDGTAAQLSDTPFTFDIDGDGNADQLASLGANSGFLALDKNGDGEINDGTELFGPKTGSGFSELAQYDLDKNNWIDENDAVFKDLAVWRNPGEEGASLLSLKDSGVGAIYLGNLSTPFTIKDASNTEQAQVRSSGIYLMEEGGVGSIQQLDLAV